MKNLYLIIAIVFSVQGFAQNFVYKPKNPAFGGDTFNYNWLLNSANAQNTMQDPASSDGRNSRDRSEIAQFAENLNNQLLNQLSRNLFNEQFGEDGNISPGSYNFGSLFVEVFNSAQGLVIDILDTNTGEQTQVIVP